MPSDACVGTNAGPGCGDAAALAAGEPRWSKRCAVTAILATALLLWTLVVLGIATLLG